jgi:hypothetical protein
MFFRPDTLENFYRPETGLCPLRQPGVRYFVIEDTLDPLTLGDVRNRAGDQYPLLGFERTETDFDWKNLDPPLRSR